MSVRILLILITLASTATVAAAEPSARELLYERTFAPDFLASESAYLIIVVPSGYGTVTVELDCNLHLGGIVLEHPSTPDAPSLDTLALACEGLGMDPAATDRVLAPGYYYGIASFTGLNGAVLRLWGA